MHNQTQNDQLIWMITVFDCDLNLLPGFAQAAGAPVACQVYEGMWHDFEEFSQGCGGRTPNEMGAIANYVHLIYSSCKL